MSDARRSRNMMTVHVIVNEHNSVYNRFLAELRDKEIQRDSMRFRRNLERAGEITAYEISKTFDYASADVVTPIGVAEAMVPDERVVVASVLRAGLPFHQGFLNCFDGAESAFVAARRHYMENHRDFEIRYDSVYTPSLKGKLLLLVDPMLATGASVVTAYRELLGRGGRPRRAHIAAVLASERGLEHVAKELGDEPVTLWVGAVDKGLTPSAYIAPGMGDAGDLAFGEKI